LVTPTRGDSKWHYPTAPIQVHSCQGITHPDTNQDQRCLTLVIKWEQELYNDCKPLLLGVVLVANIYY
jgi:hypothetical protein